MKTSPSIFAAICAMALALPLAGCATYAADVEAQLSVPAGPAGECPQGYWLGRGRQACWIRQVRPGPFGGCPQAYHLGPQGGWCWADYVG